MGNLGVIFDSLLQGPHSSNRPLSRSEAFFVWSPHSSHMAAALALTDPSRLDHGSHLLLNS